MLSGLESKGTPTSGVPPIPIESPGQGESIMRKILLRGVAALIVFGAADAYAMGGSGNLSPYASPYAILAPQTLNNGAAAFAPPPESALPPAPAKPRRQPQRRLCSAALIRRRAARSKAARPRRRARIARPRIPALARGARLSRSRAQRAGSRRPWRRRRSERGRRWWPPCPAPSQKLRRFRRETGPARG